MFRILLIMGVLILVACVAPVFAVYLLLVFMTVFAIARVAEAGIAHQVCWDAEWRRKDPKGYARFHKR